MTKRLALVLLHPTALCNADCVHCYNWEDRENNSRKNELSLEEFRHISNNLPQIDMLNITGGEPTLRLDLNLIVRQLCLHNKVKVLVINTNGINTKEIIQLARETLVHFPRTIIYLLVSLDDLEEAHDKIRGRQGCFKNALQTITALKEINRVNNNLRLGITSTYSKYNENTILDTHQFIKAKLGLYHYVNLTAGNPRLDEAKVIDLERFSKVIKAIEDSNLNLLRSKRPSFSDALNFSIEHFMRRAVEDAILYKEPFSFCQAGRKILNIASNGDVSPCPILNENLGNLRNSDYELRKILSSVKAKSILSGLAQKRCFCTLECYIRKSLLLNYKMLPRIIGKAIYFNNRLASR